MALLTPGVKALRWAWIREEGRKPGEVDLQGQDWGNYGGIGRGVPYPGRHQTACLDGMLDLQGRGSLSKGGVSAPRRVHLTSLLGLPPHTLIILVTPQS